MRKLSLKRIFLALSGILLMVVVVAGALLVWGSWITPIEKRDLRVALDKIEDLQRFQGKRNSQYQRLDSDAKNAVGLCRRRIITVYDEQVVMGVEMQLSSVEKEQIMRERASKDPAVYERYLRVVESSDQQIEAMLRSHVQGSN